MKKTLYIAATVIAVMFAASCQKDDVQAVKKGMTLSANVEETKATITDNGDKTWKFLWNGGDEVGVTSPSNKSYTFVKPESGDFTCGEAVPEAGVWRAQYPKSFANINFIGQSGILESVMANYFMTGESKNYETETTEISMTMVPKLAIIKVKNSKISDINIKYIKSIDPVLGTRTYYSYIDPMGKLYTHSKTVGEFSGTIPAGETRYYLAPVATVTMSVNEVPYGTAKTLEAGHIYYLDVK